MKNIVTAALTVIAILVVLRQCRKPAWWPGRLFLWIMNVSHSGVTNWGLSHVQVEKPFTILDVGCGGGKTVQKLAEMASDGRVYGVDYSPQSVATSRQTNAQLIRAGRVDIQQGSVSHLPFPDHTFDLVSAVETHYYWPDPAADFREVLRVLKPGGRVVVIAETYKGMRFNAVYRWGMKLLRATYLSASEHSELLRTAGYSDVTIFEEPKKGWICAVGRRPA
jgi:ubiquinone/menaquinone biosynthesis C-methylase UbiE